MMKIYCLNNLESDDSMYLMKEFRRDIFVDVNGEIYNICFIGQKRFIQELNDSMNDDSFVPDINTIVLKNIEISNIITQLTRIGEGTISCMKPCTQNGETVYFNLSDAEKKAYLESGWRISFEKKELTFIADC